MTHPHAAARPRRPRETDPARIAAAIDAAMHSRAIPDVVARRLEQIAKYGHTPEMDEAEPLHDLPRLCRDRMALIIDLCMGMGDPDKAARLGRARAEIITCAALLLASVDRIDRALGEGKGA